MVGNPICQPETLRNVGLNPWVEDPGEGGMQPLQHFTRRSWDSRGFCKCWFTGSHRTDTTNDLAQHIPWNLAWSSGTHIQILIKPHNILRESFISTPQNYTLGEMENNSNIGISNVVQYILTKGFLVALISEESAWAVMGDWV